MRRRLALVVSTPPERGDLARAAALASAAAAAGAEVGLFFMHEAVRDLPARRAELEALADAGCELCACATSADAFGVTAEQVPAVLWGSQDDHAALVHRADRVVAFT